MKNSVRILGVTILAAVYFIAAITLTYLPKNFASGNHQTTGQEQYLAITAKGLFCHTSPSESLGNSFSNSSAPNLNYLFDKLWLITQTNEQLFEAAFAQYYNFSINFLTNYRKADLIFPFHYFW